jgi:hypothetical protein
VLASAPTGITHRDAACGVATTGITQSRRRGCERTEREWQPRRGLDSLTDFVTASVFTEA